MRYRCLSREWGSLKKRIFVINTGKCESNAKLECNVDWVQSSISFQSFSRKKNEGINKYPWPFVNIFENKIRKENDK